MNVKLTEEERKGLTKSRGRWIQEKRESKTSGVAVLLERERKRMEQGCEEMIEEFDRMMGEEFINNFEIIMEQEEAERKKWEEDRRRKRE